MTSRAASGGSLGGGPSSATGAVAVVVDAAAANDKLVSVCLISEGTTAPLYLTSNGSCLDLLHSRRRMCLVCRRRRCMRSSGVVRTIVLFTPHHAFEGLLDLLKRIRGYRLTATVSICRAVSSTNMKTSGQSTGRANNNDCTYELQAY